MPNLSRLALIVSEISAFIRTDGRRTDFRVALLFVLWFWILMSYYAIKLKALVLQHFERPASLGGKKCQLLNASC